MCTAPRQEHDFEGFGGAKFDEKSMKSWPRRLKIDVFLVQKRCPKTSKMDPHVDFLILRKCARHAGESSIQGGSPVIATVVFKSKNGVQN